MKREFSAGVIVYKINNNKYFYLLLLYPRGYWDLPKGKLEPGENNLQAAIRELKEETNLEADIHKDFQETLSYIFKDFKGRTVYKEVTFFVGKALTDNIVLSEEHLNYEWLPFNQALEQLTFQNAKNVLTKADKFLNN